MAIGNYLCQQGKNEEAESWYDKVMLLAAQNPGDSDKEGFKPPPWNSFCLDED